MALPPEPIEELLPKASWVVQAEVKEVVSEGPPQPSVKAEKGATSVPYKLHSQVVKLSVKQVLRGEGAAQELTVEKPVGAYVLSPGNKGPFLIAKGSPHPVILGRYGPDSWALARIEDALKK